MNANSLDGRVAVVTGATGGMGQVIAVELARRGARVVTVARTPQRADALRRRITQAVGVDRLEVIGGDLSRRADVLAAARSIARRHPAVHLLVKKPVRISLNTGSPPMGSKCTSRWTTSPRTGSPPCFPGS